MKNLRYISKIYFSLLNNKWYVGSIILLFALLLLASYIVPEHWIKNSFNNVYTPWITVGTFILTIIIGVQNSVNKWESNLENRLTVHFKIKDDTDAWKYLLTCEKVSLSSESDIRAFSQQVGSQMTNNSRLSFDLNFCANENNPIIIKDDNSKWVKLYEVTFYLTKPPQNYKNLNYKLWYWKSSNDGKKEEERIEFISNGLRNGSLNSDSDLLKNEQSLKENSISVNKLVVNFSKHPFNKKQEKEAIQLLNFIKTDNESILIKDVDHPIVYEESPDVEPTVDKECLKKLINTYIQKIKKHNPMIVHITSEPTFTYQMVNLLKKEGIKCIASTTERIVEQQGDKKISTFNFVQFREY